MGDLRTALDELRDAFGDQLPTWDELVELRSARQQESEGENNADAHLVNQAANCIARMATAHNVPPLQIIERLMSESEGVDVCRKCGGAMDPHVACRTFPGQSDGVVIEFEHWRCPIESEGVVVEIEVAEGTGSSYITIDDVRFEIPSQLAMRLVDGDRQWFRLNSTEKEPQPLT